MKGHIRERSPGHWAIVLDIDSRDGKRRRKWHSFRGTKREAQRRLAELITDRERGEYIEPSKQTLSRYFEEWLRDWAPQKAQPKPWSVITNWPNTPSPRSVIGRCSKSAVEI
jgi:hypothetical protein